MSSTTEQIKEKLSIEEVISSYIKLERAGKNLKATCPFHNEKTPSFFVSPERESYYCFGCGRGGDIFTFVEEFEGLDFMGALKVLADRAGVDIAHADREVTDFKDRLYSATAQAVLFYENKLDDAKMAQDYLGERGLNIESIKRFNLGFAPKEWRTLYEALTSKSFTEKELLSAGLIKKQEKKEGYYDVFRSRIVFPVKDSAGRPVAFSGRIFNDDENPAKYLNTPETLLFKKSQVLFGFDGAKSTIRKRDFSIIVEGNFDVVLAHQVGYTNTVAPLGTSLSEDHLRTLGRLSKNVVFALDADSAGITSTKRSAALALAQGFDVKVAALPAGKDPADVIAKDPTVWKQAIKEAQHIIDFLLSVTKEQAKDDRGYELAVQSEVLPFIARIENKIDQGYFVKRVAELVGIPEEAIYEEIGKISIDTYQPDIHVDEEVNSSYHQLSSDKAIKELFALITWKEQQGEDTEPLKKRFAEALGVSSFTSIPYEAPQDELAFEAEMMFDGSEKLDRTEDELITHLHEQRLRQDIATRMHELRKEEVGGNEKRAQTLLQEVQELTKQLDALHAQT